MVDEQKLRQLAESATPGPWKSSGTKLQKGTRNICSHVNSGEQLPIGVDIERGISNAAFIAAANPAAILHLLDELQTLREERTAWRVTAENAEKDAARYRWLREADPDSGGPYITRSACNDWGKWFNTVELQTEADAAIDAAMKDES